MAVGQNKNQETPGLTDFDAFAQLYPSLRRFAAVVADLDCDPDDLVQDALVATLRQYQLSEIRQPTAYLKRAILNAAANHRRSASRLRRYLPQLSQPSMSHDHYPTDLAMLDVLAPLDRAVVFLADVESLPHAVVADELGLTPAAVRKRVSRGRQKLRRAVGSELRPVDASREEL